MNKRENKRLVKYIFFEILLSAILLLIGLAIVYFTNYNFKDVLFVEGMVVIILGIFSGISGNSTGLSLQGMGQNNAQYVSNANLETLKEEKEKTKNNLNPNISIGLNMVSLIIGGAICIIIDFII
ncbi:hypothetical protein psyc5s11_23910 [Clostridium gelidum]|uniref:DUF3899 domain-containing protein n=1 Tax=Clostridium gelidum TaxID=704125 RepID=A0ABM7T341_9CLOT|nr:hypothetical protein [Clostridium gelidum]BCZ46324.1 hypothetical protein psyc5s11_23910 [Clostridium gelidum]